MEIDLVNVGLVSDGVIAKLLQLDPEERVPQGAAPSATTSATAAAVSCNADVTPTPWPCETMPRPAKRDPQRSRLAAAADKLGRKALAQIDTLVTPDTLFRWYRRLITRKYDGRAKRGRSQPRRTIDIVQLVLRLAKDNPTWGYTRIPGALGNLRHDIGRNTIKRIFQDAAVTPAPERVKRTSWSAFLRAHWGAIAAMDFFTVEVLTWTGLVRYHVLFVIDLATRRVEIAGHRPSASRRLDEASRSKPD